MPQKINYCHNPFSSPETKLPYRTSKLNKKYHVAEAGHKHLILTIEGMGRMYTGYTSILFNLFSHKTTVAKNNVYCTKLSVLTYCLFLFVILYHFSFFTTKFHFAAKSGQVYAGCVNPFYVLCQQ